MRRSSARSVTPPISIGACSAPTSFTLKAPPPITQLTPVKAETRAEARDQWLLAGAECPVKLGIRACNRNTGFTYQSAPLSRITSPSTVDSYTECSCCFVRNIVSLMKAKSPEYLS